MRGSGTRSRQRRGKSGLSQGSADAPRRSSVLWIHGEWHRKSPCHRRVRGLSRFSFSLWHEHTTMFSWYLLGSGGTPRGCVVSCCSLWLCGLDGLLSLSGGACTTLSFSFSRHGTSRFQSGIPFMSDLVDYCDCGELFGGATLLGTFLYSRYFRHGGGWHISIGAETVDGRMAGPIRERCRVRRCAWRRHHATRHVTESQRGKGARVSSWLSTNVHCRLGSCLGAGSAHSTARGVDWTIRSFVACWPSSHRTCCGGEDLKPVLFPGGWPLRRRRKVKKRRRSPPRGSCGALDV